MAGRNVDLTKEEEMKQYLDNLGTEYRFGCYSEKDPEACHLLGDYLQAIKQDHTKAAKIYEINCEDHKYGHSCHKAASYKFVGKGCQRDVEAASALFARGCDLGWPASCLNIGMLEQLQSDTKIGPVEGGGIESGGVSQKEMTKTKEPDHQKALDYFKKACDGGVADGCHRYASTYIGGVEGAVEKNMSEAFTYAMKGCELGHFESCVNVSVMYKKGEGVEANEKLFKRFANIATDIMRQQRDNQERTKFQQGVETAGGSPVTK